MYTIHVTIITDSRPILKARARINRSCMCVCLYIYIYIYATFFNLALPYEIYSAVYI